MVSKPSELPRWRGGQEFTGQCGRRRRRGIDPWVGKIPWSRKWQPTPVFLPGKSHGQRSLAGYQSNPPDSSVHGVIKSQTRLSMHTC